MLGLLLFVVVAVGILLGLTQTEYFRKKLPAIIEKQAGAYLNGSLKVAAVSGNFFSGFNLKDVLLSDAADTIAFIPEAEAKYDLWPLLKGRLSVSSLEIVNPYIFLKQLPDSTWNVQHLVKSDEETVAESDTAGSSGSFEIDLAGFLIRDGRIRISSPDTIIPQQIERINTELSLFYSAGEQRLNLKQFSLDTRKPDFSLTDLSFQFGRKGKLAELKDLRLKTRQNRLAGDGKFEESSPLVADANLQTDPLQLDEFSFFLAGFRFPVAPVFQLDAHMKNDSLIASAHLSDQGEQIHLNLWLANFPELIYNRADSLLQYKITASVENIHLDKWAVMPELKYIINGNIVAEGKGIEPKTALVAVSGDFNDCLIEQKKVRKLDFKLNAERGNLSGYAEGDGQFGRFRVVPDVENFMDQNPVYTVGLTAGNLDLAQLTGIDSLKSDINGTATLTGRGFDPKTMSAKAKMLFQESTIQDARFDTVFADVAYNRENIQVDSLWVKTSGLTAGAKGNYNLRGVSDLRIFANLQSINEFKSWIPVESIETSGKLSAHLSGRTDSLQIDALLNLDNSMIDSIFFDYLAAHALAKITKTDTLADVNVQIGNIRNESFQIDSLNATAKATTKNAAVRGRAMNRDLNTVIDAFVEWGDQIRLKLNDWKLAYRKQEWELKDGPATLEMDSVNYTVKNFRMESGSGANSQTITAEGVFSMSGPEKFRLELKNIDVEKMAELAGQKFNGKGLLNANANLGGTAAAPELEAGFSFDGAEFNTYKITAFDGTFDLRSGMAKLQSRLIPEVGGKIDVSGEIPVTARLDSMSFALNPKDRVNGKLRIEQFPLAILQSLNLAEEIKGSLEGNVELGGTVESPDPKGNLRLVDASLRIPQYGVKYNKIDFSASFLPDRINLDTLRIKSPDGTMTADGQMFFSSDFYKGDISNSTIKVHFDKFNPFDHRQFNMQVSGDATLGGKKGDVNFGGALTIPKSEIYLPYLFNLMGKFNTPDIPRSILATEMEKMKNNTDSQQVKVEQSTAPDSISFDYFNNFSGKIRIKIPKNTWIKNEDMHIELSGDLELMKSKAFFEVFGSVNVVRGQYDMLGRTFIIQEGAINFSGGEDMMPDLDIKAKYTFRNAEKTEQTLVVNISGKATAPVITFTMDDSPVNEGDALSYILFGKGINELSIDQQETMQGSGNASLAGTAAASLLSSQVTKFLSNKLDVDYIEVKSDGGFDNATVVVGKYITNDLFVSYEQRFGEVDQKDMNKYEVKLEYELFKFLFLQLNNSSTDSGFDVIFKLERK